jgi:hypothetical protein
MILDEMPKTLEMVSRDLGRRLCFNGDLQVIDDEVHLDATGQAPIAQSAKGLRIRIVRAEFVEDPVLKGFAVEF